MLRTRVIPILLLRHASLVKTVKFNKFTYVGDPCNTVRIFNELEVDELIFLDITATLEARNPNFNLLREIADECFMPLCYGGGINSLEQAQKVFEIGFEKVAINSNAVTNQTLLTELSRKYGSQAVIASIDVKYDFWGQPTVRTISGKKNTKLDPVVWAQILEARGAGEILLTSIDREGTWSGFDFELVSRVSDAVSIPVIAHGGAGCLDDIRRVVKGSRASAVGLGSMVTFQKEGMGVLVHFPDKSKLTSVLS